MYQARDRAVVRTLPIPSRVCGEATVVQPRATEAGHSRVTLVTKIAITSGARTVTGGHSGVTGSRPRPLFLNHAIPLRPHLQSHLYISRSQCCEGTRRHAGSQAPMRNILSRCSFNLNTNNCVLTKVRSRPEQRVGKPRQASVQAGHAHPP